MSSRLDLGWWRPAAMNPTADAAAARRVLGDLDTSVVVVQTPTGPAVANGGIVFSGTDIPVCDPSTQTGMSVPPLLLLAYLPPMPPKQLGDPGFMADHRLKYPYMTGAMANGIASCEIVEAMSRAGMLGSFGAAGLSIDRVTQAIDRLQANLKDLPFAINLIHSPNEPAHEAALVELLLNRDVKLIEASAYLDLTPSVVRYRLAGLSREADGNPVIGNRIIAKVSRTEVATRFLSPAPTRIVKELLAAGLVTDEQAELSQTVPMCDDLTAEADSGGHTDNRPAITLLPTLLVLRDRLQDQFHYLAEPRVGLAGGIATPASTAAAFALGAAYCVTGSINQACRESGSSDAVRKMLADAGQADVIMAPAADMFEMGVKVQVLKRGTMFAMRGAKLFELYRAYPSWQAIPEGERVQIEKNLLRASFQEIWEITRAFFEKRDPTQLVKAATDPKHQMALVFRWYLGLSSRWANAGDSTRQLDYQVWCGPAMGAFNEWVKGSHLEQPANRTVVNVARNLLYGACVETRRHQLRTAGVHLPGDWFPTKPLVDGEIRI